MKREIYKIERVDNGWLVTIDDNTNPPARENTEVYQDSDYFEDERMIKVDSLFDALYSTFEPYFQNSYVPGLAMSLEEGLHEQTTEEEENGEEGEEKREEG